jgi:DNA-binding MarR family transcriptional regulator
MTITAPTITELALWQTRILSRAQLHNLGISSLQILCELASRGDSLMTTLARKLGVSSSAITGLADSLAEAGLIHRVASRTDRRKIWIVLTERGSTVITEILNA